MFRRRADSCSRYRQVLGVLDLRGEPAFQLRPDGGVDVAGVADGVELVLQLRDGQPRVPAEVGAGAVDGVGDAGGELLGPHPLEVQQFVDAAGPAGPVGAGEEVEVLVGGAVRVVRELILGPGGAEGADGVGGVVGVVRAFAVGAEAVLPEGRGGGEGDGERRRQGAADEAGKRRTRAGTACGGHHAVLPGGRMGNGAPTSGDRTHRTGPRTPAGQPFAGRAALFPRGPTGRAGRARA